MKAAIYSHLADIKKHYDQGGNVIQYIRQLENRHTNSPESILISYDMQAGSYVEFVRSKPEINESYTSELARILDELGTEGSLLEAGVGEATTLANMTGKLLHKPAFVGGFDISWSRIRYAKAFAKHKQLEEALLFTGDLFRIPLTDNSIDIVYTSHSIEPNGGREEEALRELYRVARRYLVLLEPAYELAGAEARQRMEQHGYVRGLKQTAENLGYKIQAYHLFEGYSNPLNPTGVMVIAKEPDASGSGFELACPLSRKPLELQDDCYFCPESILAYPIVGGIPCLLPENSILASKFTENIQL
jgi:uncharacterized protein YbaR (Trm112 family)